MTPAFYGGGQLFANFYTKNICIFQYKYCILLSMRATNNEQPDLFKQKRGRAAEGKKITLRHLLIVVGVAVLVAVLCFLWLNRKKPIAETPITEAEVVKGIRKSQIGANLVDSAEGADEVITQVDELLNQTSDIAQRYDLLLVKAQSYSNSNRYEKEVETLEYMLTIPDFSEEQRLQIYRMSAETYVYFLQDPPQLKKWLDLMRNSNARVTDDITSQSYIDMGWFERRLEQQLGGNYAF
jgi:hypothetical protein